MGLDIAAMRAIDEVTDRVVIDKVTWMTTEWATQLANERVTDWLALQAIKVATDRVFQMTAQAIERAIHV